MSCGLRDVVEFEAGGRPAVLIASDAFVQAAEEQSRKLGQPDVRRVFVAHPVADRTDDEMHALARQAVDDVLSALSA